MVDNSYIKRRRHFEDRLAVLMGERTKLEPELKEINQFLSPETGAFNEPITEKKTKKDSYYKQNINTLPSYYVNNLATAMVTNLTPSRLKWFRLKVEDETREESIYLTEAANKMYRVFSATGLYENLYGSFKEAILYGINLLGVQRDFNTGFRFFPMTIGEYWVEEGENGVIDTCYRRFAMTNIQLLRKFGKDNLPERIKRELALDQTENLNTVIHAVEPNPDYLPQFENYANKPFISVYYLQDEQLAGFLDYRTTSYFPYMVARWERTNSNPYGVGVGHQILPDVKSLQAYEKDLAKASKKKIDPPLKGSNTLRNAVKDASANGITYTDDPNGFTPLYNVNYETREALENITRISQRIYQLTYNDLFYALLNKDKYMSATEAQGIQQEKLTMLGSVVERLQTEFMKNLVETCFTILYQQGVFGEPPASLIGKDMKVEYSSLLAMTQDINDLSMIERYLRFVSSVAAINPDVARKPDVMAMADFYGRSLGIDQKLIVPTSTVEREMQEQAMYQQQLQQQQAQQEAMLAQAKAAKDLSQAQSNAGGALEEMLGG